MNILCREQEHCLFSHCSGVQYVLSQQLLKELLHEDHNTQDTLFHSVASHFPRKGRGCLMHPPHLASVISDVFMFGFLSLYNLEFGIVLLL